MLKKGRPRVCCATRLNGASEATSASGHTGFGCGECRKLVFTLGRAMSAKNARYYSLICLGVMLFFLAIAMVVFADKVDKFRKYAMGTKRS